MTALDHRAADRRAVRAARQRRLDRARAGRRRVDRHGALLVAPGRRRDGGHDLGLGVVVDADRAAAVRAGWARSCSARGCPRTCSAAWRRGSSACPGRLLHTNIIGCTIFAAVSGSSAATCATIGKMTLPGAQERAAIPEGITIGTLAGAGTLGLLIPPSIIMIVYGVTANVSIAQLFIAGDPARHPAGGAVLRLHRRVGAPQSRTRSPRRPSARRSRRSSTRRAT